MKKCRIGISVILLFTSLILLNYTSSLTHSDHFEQNNPPFFSFPDIYIDYNSTYYKQQISCNLQLELHEFNCLTVLFTTSGDKTNNEGIRIVFTFGEIEVSFLIERLFQDHLGHNLTQFFSYPESFSGEMDVLITVEAQTSLWYESGSIRIFSYSNVERIEPAIVTEYGSSFPVVPNWLRFMGSSSSSEIRTVTTVFNNSENFDNVNLTLSFQANDFTAYKQHFELYVNDQLRSTREFRENQLTTESFMLAVDSGINYLTIDFVVEICIGEIQFSKINLSGKGIDFEDFLPENTYTCFKWERNEFDHTFDLSPLKPIVSYSEQILEMEMDYGYHSAVATSINYEINIGEKSLDSGEIIADGQAPSPLTISVKSPLIHSDDALVFRIQGIAEEPGIFYLLNSSYVSIEPLPELQEQGSLERVLVENESYSTPSSEPLILIFKDYCEVTPDYLHCNISLSFSLLNEFGSAVRQIDVLMKVDLLTVIDTQISYEKQVNINEQQIFYSNLYEVTVILSIYGDGFAVILNDLKYKFSEYLNDTSSPNPFDIPKYQDSNPLSPVKSTILYIEYGCLLLFFVIIFSQGLLRRKEKGRTVQENEEEERELTRFKRIVRFPKKWWLKAKESFFRVWLLPTSICYLGLKAETLGRIAEEFVTIANSYNLNLIHPDLGKWGFYSFIICVLVSSFVTLSALFLSLTSTFYKDLFLVSQLLGIVIFIIYIPSSILLLLYLSSNGYMVEIFKVVVLLCLFLSIIVFLKYLRKTENEQRKEIVKFFFKNKESEITDTTSNLTVNRTVGEDLSQEQYNDYKQKLLNYIIYKITPEIQVSANRFAERFHISLELAHNLLIAISNDHSGLGEYFIEEQIYKRSSTNEMSSLYLDIRSQKKHGELISKYNKNNVNSEKTPHNNVDNENQTPKKIPISSSFDDFYYYNKRLSTLNWLTTPILTDYFRYKLKIRTSKLDFKKYANVFFNNRGDVKIDDVDDYMDFFLHFSNSLTRNLSYSKYKEFFQVLGLKEEWISVVDLIKKHKLDDKFAFQIARYYLKIYELKMKDTNILKGECSFAEVIYSIFKYLWLANLYLENVKNIADGWKKWENIRYTFRTIFGVIELPFLGNIKAVPIINTSSKNDNRIYQDGIFCFNSSSSDKPPFLTIDTKQLALTYNAINLRLKDEKSLESFYNTRSGTDLITPSSLVSFKDRSSSMMSPSHLFNTVCELKSQNIGQLFIFGTLGDIPVYIDNKKVDFLNLSYQLYSGNESYKEIKERIENKIFPHIHHLMDEHGIFQKIKQVPSDAESTVYRTVNDFKRMWLSLDLLSMAFDHAMIKSIGVNLENNFLNTQIFANYQEIGERSTINRPARLRNKVPILPNFYPEVDVRIIQKVLESEKLISPETIVDFGFYTSHSFESITNIQLIVYGLSKHKKKELRFLTLTDLMKKYALIERNLPKNEQNRKLLLLNYETDSNLSEIHKCKIGNERFVIIIENKDSINYTQKIEPISNLLVYDENQSDFVFSNTNTIISPKSFWNPVFHKNKYYLTLRGEDLVPHTKVLRFSGREILPGWIDLSKGILPCWNYEKEQNNIPSETIIKHHRKTMFEFLLTRYLPIIEAQTKIVDDKIKYEAAIAHYPVDIAISKLKALKEYIIGAYKDTKLSKEQISELEHNKEKTRVIYQLLYEIDSLPFTSTSEFDVDILLSKISETIQYYDDLYRYSPNLELFVNYFDKTEKIPVQYRNKVIKDSNNVPYPKPLQVTHYFTTASKTSRRYSQNLLKIYTNQDVKRNKYGKTHLAGYIADNNFYKTNENGTKLYRVNGRKYVPNQLIHNPLDSIQLILFRYRLSMRDANEFYSKYNLGEGDILSLVTTRRNKEDQTHIKELSMKTFDIINQHAKQTDHILSNGIRTVYNDMLTLYSTLDLSLQKVIQSTNIKLAEEIWKFLSEKQYSRKSLQFDFAENSIMMLKKNKLLKGLLSSDMLNIIPISKHLQPNNPENMLKLFAIPYEFLSALTRLKDWKYPELSFITLISGAGNRQAALVNQRLVSMYGNILYDNQHKITKKLDKTIIDNLLQAISIVKNHYTDYKQISLKGGLRGDVLRKEIYSKKIEDSFEIVAALEHLVNFDYLYKSQLTIGEQIEDLGGKNHLILREPLKFKSFVVYCQNIGILRRNIKGTYNYKIISENKVNAPFSLSNQQTTIGHIFNCRILTPAGIIDKNGNFTNEIQKTLVFDALQDSSRKLSKALKFAELVRNGENTADAHRKIYRDDDYFISKNNSIEKIMLWTNLV